MQERDESKKRIAFAVARRVFGYGILICLASFIVVCLWFYFCIRYSVNEISAQATTEYQGDRIEALITYVKSESHTLRQRNRSVWALGQIGDNRALPVLEKYYVGQPCDHNVALCQGELKKAIKHCKSGDTAWLAF